MHIIFDFVLCWVYEWPVMQISNASFPHSAGHHPVLMTKICLRPERVHEFRFSVINNNSKYISLHCLSWRRTQPYDIAERPIASDGGVSHPPFSSFDWGICWPITAESNIHERRRADSGVAGLVCIQRQRDPGPQGPKTWGGSVTEGQIHAFGVLDYVPDLVWLFFTQELASKLPPSKPHNGGPVFCVFSQDLGLLLWGLLFGR